MTSNTDRPAPRRFDGLTVAFDLDGTLVDTAPDLVDVLNIVLTGEGLAPLPYEAARLMIGRGARGLLERGFAAEDAPLDEARAGRLTETFIALYRERIARDSRPFPGVEAVLDALAADGAKLSVCTNKRTDLSVALLEALDLRRRFAAVVGADAAPAPKPDRRHVIAAVEAAGGSAERAIMVGDSAADVDAARAAGVPSVLVSFGYTEIPPIDLGADVLIDDYAELVDAIEALIAPCSAQAVGL